MSESAEDYYSLQNADLIAENEQLRALLAAAQLTGAGTWKHDTPPLDGTWCWVSSGGDVWIAKREARCSGGWTNEDTWENFERAVRFWMPIERPEPPSVQVEGRHRRLMNINADGRVRSGAGSGAWRPIATAPRDGTEMLVLLDSASVAVVHIAWYRSRDEWEASGRLCGGWDTLEDWEGWWSYTRNSVGQEKLDGNHTPTHWLPLPQAPTRA